MRFIVLSFLCFFGTGALASKPLRIPASSENSILILVETEFSHVMDSLPGKSVRKKENPRVMAAILCASLGLFGVHRMYLGTDVRVPVFYTLTIGGGVALWLADLGIILFSESLEPYMNNTHVFMWKGK